MFATCRATIVGHLLLEIETWQAVGEPFEKTSVACGALKTFFRDKMEPSCLSINFLLVGPFPPPSLLLSFPPSLTLRLSVAAGPRPSGLRPIPCQEPSDCGQNVLQGAYCDLEYMMCSCKPDYPVTDSLNCYKGNETRSRSSEIIFYSYIFNGIKRRTSRITNCT